MHSIHVQKSLLCSFTNSNASFCQSRNDHFPNPSIKKNNTHRRADSFFGITYFLLFQDGEDRTLEIGVRITQY